MKTTGWLLSQTINQVKQMGNLFSFAEPKFENHNTCTNQSQRTRSSSGIKWHKMVDLFPMILPLVLHEWLDVSSLCIFETALSNQILRNYFLSVLKDMTFSDGCISAISDDLLLQLSRKQRELPLVHLNFLSCRNVTEIGINSIINQSPYLKSLKYLGGSELVDPVDVKNLHNLEEIYIEHSNNIFLNISSRFGITLRSISVPYCNVTSETIILISVSCPRLECLNLKGCDLIQDDCIISLSERCPNLKELDLTYCDNITDSSIICLAASCPQLHTLSLSACHYISEVSLQSLAAQQPCSLLSSLNLSGCVGISELSLLLLTSKCPFLTNLSLVYCKDPTTDQIISEGIARFCPKLVELNLYGCALLTDSSMISLSVGCPLLTSLNLHGCLQLTDISIDHLSLNCHFLSILDLSDCYQITDSSVLHLSVRCPLLVDLSMAYCDHISDVSVLSLMLTGPGKLGLLGKILTDEDDGKIGLISNRRKIKSQVETTQEMINEVQSTDTNGMGSHWGRDRPYRLRLEQLNLNGCDLVSEPILELLGVYLSF